MHVCVISYLTSLRFPSSVSVDVVPEASVLFKTVAVNVVEHLRSDILRSLSFRQQLHIQHAGTCR